MGISIHKIRLRGPWLRCDGTEFDPDIAQPVRLHKDLAEAIQPESCDTKVQEAVYRRVFHRPTGLTSETRLLIVVLGPPEVSKIVLNGRDVTVREISLDRSRADITLGVQAENRLDVHLRALCPALPRLLDAWIEIHEP